MKPLTTLIFSAAISLAVHADQARAGDCSARIITNYKTQITYVEKLPLNCPSDLIKDTARIKPEKRDMLVAGLEPCKMERRVRSRIDNKCYLPKYLPENQ